MDECYFIEDCNQALKYGDSGRTGSTRKNPVFHFPENDNKRLMPIILNGIFFSPV
jgi:hypothetical protein